MTDAPATPKRQVRLVLVLSENWTLVAPGDLRALVRMAQEAEAAGFDGVMISEHVVLGAGADAGGLMANPREYALPGNQDPRTPWPHSLLLLSAIATVTSELRLIASAIIPPLRHPLLHAQELATLDRLCEGRLVVQPTVSWHAAEYRALGVPFGERGRRLDEHLAAWREVWRSTPASFHGRHYSFDDVYLEPGPYRPEGPRMWFGGSSVHRRLVERLVGYGSGFNPLGPVSDSDLARLREAFDAAGRDWAEVEMVGGVRGRFPAPDAVADLAEALESIPRQLGQGFRTFCLKPSQFTDDISQVGAVCREAVARTARLTA
ncbi:MAG TPA: TIGR03619 family F420-dependent LLM class oxidoreductase [Solirubrobacteraceae bacterium]|nr:TIGR03619 family F420-dependent LLM class oxidoreductase [Solirubrobacteraceae bacterium]